ncbi:MAG: hypothetical protein QGH76_05510 [Phycisphaerales bacterium]|jgi:hypothetical protein|nr:hypothetical protein [Phycisphaerales bacterium]
MAIRTDAGTGVIVSLVVFVLTTVFLLVLSIVFYVGKTEQATLAKDAEQSLTEFVTPAEQSSDAFQAIASLASSERSSVAGYLNGQLEDLRQLVSGSRSSTLDQIRAQFADAIGGGGSLTLAFDRMQRQLNERQQELDARMAELETAREEVRKLNKDIGVERATREESVAAAKLEWKGLQEGAIEHGRNVDSFFASRSQRDSELRNEFSSRMSMLEEENDALLEEKAQLAGRVRELQEIMNAGRVAVSDPALLVDGRVLEVTGSDRVFLNRGARDRIVLGMTFEIYDDSAQLRPDSDGDMPRGKASVEVIKVGDTTSTAKVTRSNRGRPIVRDDILVNALYDPTYQYKFLVHGRFDANGDGIPESGHDFVDQQIDDWGGVVVEDDGGIPGDLDFLVLGIQPTSPRPLPLNASPLMVEQHNRQQEAYEAYMKLFEQATEAQVPILNANRLQVLTGSVR